MSAFSYELLMQANFVANATTRNSNYRYLLQNINNQLIEVIQTELKEDTAPLYMQVYVKDGRRTDLQKNLCQRGFIVQSFGQLRMRCLRAAQ